MIQLDSLNEMQKKAVLQTEGPVLMLAGAGSGKTKALTYRIAHMVESGIYPWRILAITFTNKAAREMRERVNQLVGEKAGEIFVSTFHSACVRFLRKDIEKLGQPFTRSFTIYDGDDQKTVIKQCLKKLKVDDGIFKPNKVLGAISRQKDELIGPVQFKRIAEGDFYQETIAKLYSEYQNTLKNNNALDFDDIIFKTVELFIKLPEVLEAYQERFRYIMVDEYQDTNTAQYLLVKTLAEKYQNLCVVGDDDQSIYGWRGANIQNIFDFEKDFPEAKVIKLEQNYRSTSNILDTANAVISKNYSRKDKQLWTEKGAGDKVKIYAAPNEYEEGLFIVNEIKKRYSLRLKDVAVLYRTNAQSRVLEDAFVRKNIPYRISMPFYDRKEIKDVLAYLRVIVNPNDDISVRRIINVPKRGAGKVAIEKINDYAEEAGTSFFGAMAELYNDDSPLLSKRLRIFFEMMYRFVQEGDTPEIVSLIERLLKYSGYMAMLEEEEVADDANSRVENIKELINKAAEFEANKDPKECSLITFLEEVALVADIDTYADDLEAVTLMTIHSAKGLEFPVVFLAGLEDGLFPGYNALTYGGPSAIEEERRLFYVGITRAKEKIYLLRAKSRMTRGFTEYASPSRFLKEIPAEFVEDAPDPLTQKPPQAMTHQASQINAYTKMTTRRSRQGLNFLPKNVTLDFVEGDTVRHKKFGEGVVKKIEPAGRDYEVTVEFPHLGVKKFMAMLAGLRKSI